MGMMEDMGETPIHREPQMPTATDKLFNDFNEDYRHNAIIRTGQSHFFLFSDAYRIAAENLFKQLDGSAYMANSLVYPLVFLNRHFLELRLKEVISALNFAKDHDYKFPNGHGLRSLWDTYKKLLGELDLLKGLEKDVVNNVQRLIYEFDAIDAGSFAFRYPVDRSEERNPSLTMTNLDIQNFQTTMSKLYDFFDLQSDIAFHMVDQTEEYISIMRSEYGY